MKSVLTLPIEKVMDATYDAVCAMIKAGEAKELTPVFTGLTATGGIVFIPCLWTSENEKRLMIQAVKRAFAEQQVVAYTQTAEVWTSPTLDAEAKANGGEITRLPSEMSDREEQVMIVGCNGIKTCIRHYLIDRNDAGVITGLRLKEQHDDIQMGGRMADMLPPQEAGAA